MAAKRNDDELTAILRAVPQRIVGRMLGGRQTVHLQRMADRWAFPVDGRTVDLFAVMARLWSFLKQYGPMLQVLMEDTGDQEGDSLGAQYLKAKIRKTQADADAAELRVRQKAGTLCFADDVHQCFNAIVDRFHKGCDHAQAKWGADGADFFEQLADGIKSDILATIGRGVAANDEQAGDEAVTATSADVS
jgi:hypothetical protein